MSTQTRAAFLAEFRDARAAEDFDRVIGLILAAIAHDAEHPDELRLMDELRGLSAKAAV